MISAPLPAPGPPSRARAGLPFVTFPSLPSRLSSLWQAGTLAKHGVELIGAKLGPIRKAEDRLLFKEAMERIGLKCAESGACNTCGGPPAAVAQNRPEREKERARFSASGAFSPGGVGTAARERRAPRHGRRTRAERSLWALHSLPALPRARSSSASDRASWIRPPPPAQPGGVPQGG